MVEQPAASAVGGRGASSPSSAASPSSVASAALAARRYHERRLVGCNMELSFLQAWFADTLPLRQPAANSEVLFSRRRQPDSRAPHQNAVLYANRRLCSLWGPMPVPAREPFCQLPAGSAHSIVGRRLLHPS